MLRKILVQRVNTLLSISLILFIVLPTAVSAFGFSKSFDEPETFTKNEQHALVSPSVVRVVMSTKGTLTVKPFQLDIKNFAIIPEQYGDPYTEPIDRTVTGTAFSVSDTGAYITNAHVVSPYMIRAETAMKFMMLMMMQEIQSIVMRYGENSPQVKAYEEALEEIGSLDESDPKVKKFRDAILERVTYSEDEQKVSILHQDSELQSINTFHEDGFEVTEVFTGDEWYFESKDVALLLTSKDASSPAIPLLQKGEEANINTDVIAYGFPGSTDISLKTFADVTVTQGSITSMKQPTKDGPTIMQVDTKISQGSSGGPLVNEKGVVLGVITAETGSESGDNFGFAYPISLAHELLDNKPHPVIKTEYNHIVREALTYKANKRCKKANKLFDEAVQLNASWNIAKEQIQILKDECNTLIESGESIDSFFAETIDYIKNAHVLIWVFIIGGSLLIIGGVTSFLLLHRKQSYAVQQEQQTISQTTAINRNINALNDSPTETVEEMQSKTSKNEQMNQQTKTTNTPSTQAPVKSDNQTQVPQGAGGWFVNQKPLSETTDTEDKNRTQ